jgi:hypothetical protein
VTVKLVDANVLVGVPVIAPLDALNIRPAGSAGAIAQLATGPPLFVGVSETGVCVVSVSWVTFDPPCS